MRKLFALVATIAMVLSMFAGIAFAVVPPAIKAVVTLNNSTLIWGEDSYHITGNVTVNGIAPTDALTYTLTLEGTPATTIQGVTVNGSIDLTAEAANMLVNQDYTLSFTGNDVAKYTIADKTIKTRYNLAIDQNLSGLTYLNKNIVLSGRVSDSKGKAVAGLTVDATDAAATMDTLSNGSFALAIPSVNVGGKGAFVVTVDGVDYKTCDVAALGFSTLTVSPTSTVHTAIPTVLTFVTKETVGGVENTLVDTDGVTFTLTGVRIPVANVVAGDIDAANSVKTADNAYYTTLVVTKHTTTIGFTEAGIVTVTANWGGKRVGTTSFEVQAPAAVNVLNVPSSINVASTLVNMDVRNAAGVQPTTVKVAASGAGFTMEEAVVAVSGGVYPVTLIPTQQGTIAVNVKAYDADGKLLDTITKTVTVKGYTITVSKSEVTVNMDSDIVVTVFNGTTPINNATVALLATGGATVVSVDPSKANISNGAYTLTHKYTTVESLTLTVTDPVTGNVMASLANAVNVVGDQVYTVQMDKAAVLAGSTTSVVFSVYGSNGAAIAGATVDAYYDDSKTVGATGTTDAAGDATISVVPTKSMVVIVHTDAGTKIGKLTVDVKQPIIEISQSNISEGYKELLTINLKNPLDGTALTGYKLVAVDSFTSNSLFTKADKAIAYNLDAALAASKYEFYAMVTDIRTTDEKTAGKTPALQFNVIKDATVAIKQPVAVETATLALSTTTMFLETNTQLTITLTDAHDVGMKDREVKLNGTAIGTTDDNGVIVYNYRPLATGNYNFTTVKDNNAVITTTAKAVIDTVAPVITATAKRTADGVVVAGNVTDNTRVTRIIVNNTEVVVIPGAAVNFTYTLPATTTAVSVMAFDVAGNGAVANPTITYTPAVGKRVVLQGATVSRKGEFTFVQIRQFEQLGATLNWNDTTKTATFTVGGKTVEVHIGSLIAKVNGIAVAMPTAPYIANGRTMVPTRFISEHLGWNVYWAVGDIITITIP